MPESSANWEWRCLEAGPPTKEGGEDRFIDLRVVSRHDARMTFEVISDNEWDSNPKVLASFQLTPENVKSLCGFLQASTVIHTEE